MSTLNDSACEQVQLLPSMALHRDASSVDLMVEGDGVFDGSQIRYGFQIAGMGLLVDANTVAEVVPRPVPIRIPRTPAWFSGLTNLRGTLVPMFDLKLLMGLDDNLRGHDNFALIVGQGDEAMGFFIENYPLGLDNLEVVKEKPPLSKLLMPFSGQAYYANDSIYVELNYPRFFSSLSAKLAA